MNLVGIVVECLLMQLACTQIFDMMDNYLVVVCIDIISDELCGNCETSSSETVADICDILEGQRSV